MVLSKDSTTIVGDGSSQAAVEKRVAQIRNLIEARRLVAIIFFSLAQIDSIFINHRYAWFSKQAAEQDYEKEKLNERIAKLSGGVAVIQVSTKLVILGRDKVLYFLMFAYPVLSCTL